MSEAARQQAKAMWLSTRQAGELLGGVSVQQVRAWVANGQLTAFDASEKPGITRPDWRFKPEWIAEFEAKRTSKAA